MFAAERIEKIRNVLLEYKHADVTSLSNIMSVSEATIRRDLEKLENEGFLKRTHGGAILNEEIAEEMPFMADDIPNLEEKNSIGLIASQLVENNDIIGIGSGSTCLQFAKALKDKKGLTIVTNNILISMELSKYKDIKVVLTGGDVLVLENSMSLVGEFTHKMLETIFMDKVFLSVSGIDIKYGYTAINSELALVWKQMSRLGEEVIILGDYTKFNKRSFVRLGPLSSGYKIVTNEQVSEEFKQYYFENGIPMYTSYKLDT